MAQLCLTLWDPTGPVVNQASLFMEFPRQEYWSGFPFPSPGNLPDPGTKPTSLESPALAGGFFTNMPLNAFECINNFLHFMCIKCSS